MGFFGKDQRGTGFSSSVPGGVTVDPRFQLGAGGTPDAAARRGGTVIGPNTKVQGELSGDEDIVVDGRVEGKIAVKKQLTIGPSGSVQADVHARNVLIAGKVTGNVSAEDKVEIVATGSLEGNIRAAKIVIAEGAHFKGSVEMSARRDGEPSPARDERPEKGSVPAQKSKS